jgi:hypothetical protein
MGEGDLVLENWLDTRDKFEIDSNVVMKAGFT